MNKFKMLICAHDENFIASHSHFLGRYKNKRFEYYLGIIIFVSHLRSNEL